MNLFENRSTFAEVMSNYVPGRFFMKHGVPRVKQLFVYIFTVACY